MCRLRIVTAVAVAAAAGEFFVAATRRYALSAGEFPEAIDQGIDQLLVAPILTDVEKQQDSDRRGQFQQFEMNDSIITGGWNPPYPNET